MKSSAMSKLIIDTEQEDDCVMYIVGLNMQTINYSGGMAGLAFSK